MYQLKYTAVTTTNKLNFLKALFRNTLHHRPLELHWPPQDALEARFAELCAMEGDALEDQTYDLCLRLFGTKIRGVGWDHCSDVYS